MKGKITKMLLAAAVVSSVIIGGTTSAYAESTISQDIIVNRIYGPDRYCTSMELMGKPSKNLIIVNGLDYADALSASALAVKEEASIILTNGKSIPFSLEYNFDTYMDYEFDKIIIVGGTSAVSTNIEKQVKPYCNSVVRLAGPTRYETSVEVAKYLGDFDDAFLATGLNFADALSASSIAAKNGTPILLTNGKEITDETKNVLKGKNVYILGGKAAIASSVEKNFSTVKRLGGYDRYETNKNVVSEFSSEFTGGKAYVATGINFPDALAVSAKAGNEAAPIILTASSPNQYTKDIIKGQNIKELIAVGGPVVIDPQTMENLAGRTINADVASKSVNEIKEYAKSIGLSKLPSGSDNSLFYFAEDGTTPVYGGFFDNLSASIPESGYSQTETSVTISVSNPIKYKNYILPILKMALPNSGQAVYDLLCSDQNLPSQELYLDGKRVEVANDESGAGATIYYSNPTYKSSF